VIIDAVGAVLTWLADGAFKGMLSQPAKATKVSRETARDR
jgi:hypothetical protein